MTTAEGNQLAIHAMPMRSGCADSDDTVAAIAAAVGYRSEYFVLPRVHAPSRARARPVPAPRPRPGARSRIEARRRNSDDLQIVLRLYIV